MLSIYCPKYNDKQFTYIILCNCYSVYIKYLDLRYLSGSPKITSLLSVGTMNSLYYCVIFLLLLTFIPAQTAENYQILLQSSISMESCHFHAYYYCLSLP